MADADPAAEARLVLACAAGDPASWETLVDRYGGLVAALARRMLARRTGRAQDADVDEVVAGVFLALVRDDRRLLRRYRPEFRFTTYLGVICRTEVGRHVRRRRPTASLDGRVGESVRADATPSDPERALLERERLEAARTVRRALDRLEPRDRSLLTLRFLEDADYGRIAEALSVRRDSVGQLLHRAKQRLRALVPEVGRWLDASEGEGPT